MLTLALCTTALGTLLPMLRDPGQRGSGFGRLFVAAGAGSTAVDGAQRWTQAPRTGR